VAAPVAVSNHSVQRPTLIRPFLLNVRPLHVDSNLD